MDCETHISFRPSSSENHSNLPTRTKPVIICGTNECNQRAEPETCLCSEETRKSEDFLLQFVRKALQKKQMGQTEHYIPRLHVVRRETIPRIGVPVTKKYFVTVV
jgi:hypothetical protein